MVDNQLLSKLGEVIMQLSRMLLSYSEKDQLPTNQTLAKELNAGVGTIQSAFKYFEENGALSLASHGHQGTVIETIDYIKLFKCNPTLWITGEMPLLYSTALEGLATALYKEFDRADVLLKLTYVRGGKTRINYLKEDKVDFTVCSRMTAEEAVAKDPGLEILMSLGPKTYVPFSGIFFSRPGCSEIEDGMKMGVDMDSMDHVKLNHLAAGEKKVDFVRLKYSEIIPKIVSGEIDATVWSFDNIRTSEMEKCYLVPAAGELEKKIAPAEEAVLLITKDHYAKNLIRAVLDIEDICRIQKAVIERKLIPSY
ncbi:MAG: hypothetical protein IJM08_00360 [Firmicutes bacterium]|nr:hypothetical protein [Bacillota bacterium]